MLPRETRGYVPLFIAATYVMSYYEEHNLTPEKCELPILCDTIMTSERIHLEQISKIMGVDIAVLRSLNPQYRRDIIPGKDKSYAIKKFNSHIEEVKKVIPKNQLLIFEAKEGWEPLCDFLGVPVPQTDYPRTRPDLPNHEPRGSTQNVHETLIFVRRPT